MAFHARSRYITSTLIAAIFLSLLLSGFSVPTLSADPTDLPIHIHLTWQHETNTTITVTWQTSTNTSGDIVLYDNVSRGGVPGDYRYNATGINYTYTDASGYIHDVELTGLNPDTVYYFICGGPTGGYSSERAFRTAPSAPIEPGMGTYVRFVMGGDSRTNPDEREKISKAMAKFNPAFAIHDGDMVDDGRVQSQWDSWFSDVDSHWIGENNLTIPIIPAVGNHERPDSPSTKYYVQFALPGNEKYYSLDWGPDIHIIVLDSEDDASPATQAAWLESDLINHSSALWKIAIFHRPPFVTGIHDPWQPARTYWVPLFDKYHVDLVVCGHEHSYQRTYPINWTASQTEPQDYSNGTLYIVSGGWGAPLYNPGNAWWQAYVNKTYHFCLVDIDGTSLRLQAKDNLGNTFDEVTITKRPLVGVSAQFGYAPLNPPLAIVNETITFDASASKSGNGTHYFPIINYTWNFGDTNITTTSNPIITHEYTVNDTYTVTLNVTDSREHWNTTSRTIEVYPSIHDLAVTNVSVFRTVVASGYDTEIDVTAENRGTYIETFNVTVYYSNSSWHLIEKRTNLELYPKANITLTFTWTTTGISKGDYTIIANVSMIPGETNTTDNTFVNIDAVKVTLVGDIDGDGYVYVLDLSLLGGSWRQRRGQPNYNPNADIDADNYVYVLDLSLLGAHWRQRDP